MNHQNELDKTKYRNWVRGGLAYKYIKDGIETFVDDVVLQEHTRILSSVNHTSGVNCNQCCLRNLRPLHKYVKDSPTGKSICPWRQSNCNCLYTKKKSCPCNTCDAIMEEILKSHGSAPPTPNWKNTDMQKWCSDPWEIAKCFINAPGYSDKTKAAETDTSGLLQILINNITLRSHLSDGINKSDLLEKTLQRRNELFHSPSMEMEDAKLNECIDDIIEILEDDKELKARNSAQQAVVKLKQLKQESFIITTHNEVEVCRDALVFITSKSEELKQTIQDAKDDIGKKQTETTEGIEDKVNTALQGALEDLDNRNETLYERITRVESEISTIKQRLIEVEGKVEKLDAVREHHQKQLDYVEAKQALQHNLVKLYQQSNVKTSISPLKKQQNDINVKEIYVSPKLVLEEETRSTPREEGGNISNKPKKRTINRYQEIFETNGQRHKNIYILGDVGTGKSTFCKMMIENWCIAVTGDTRECATGDKYKTLSESTTYCQSDELSSDTAAENVNEMKNFDFLFFIPLQRMSGWTDIIDMIKAVAAAADLATPNLLDVLFQQESGRCLIVADGLDEWTYPSCANLLPHVSYGLPNRSRTKHATLVTLSRPSAKGILNMEYSECDQKVELLGIHTKSVKCFIENYLAKFNESQLSSLAFLSRIQNTELIELEKSPLFLQQLVWLHASGNEIGESVSDTYSHLVNIMLGWSHIRNKGNCREEDQIDVINQEKDMQLPKLLRRFPRCEANERFLLPLAQVAFETLTSERRSSTFGRSYLQKKGVSNDVITTLINFGMCVEANCFDPTLETTELEFIHKSYHEFFAAVYVSCHYNEDQYSATPVKRILQELFQKCTSATDVLQLSNVLKMISGLAPFLIPELSNLISDIVDRDENMTKYRYKLCKGFTHTQLPSQIQRLVFNCLSVCDKSMVSLCDVVIGSSTQLLDLQRIKPWSVLSLNAADISNEKVWQWIAGLKWVQYIRIVRGRFPHNDTILSSIIQESNLKRLCLLCKCVNANCEGHKISLSKAYQLQYLTFYVCDHLVTSNINTTSLERLCLNYSGINEFDWNCLTNASCLEHLTLVGTSFRYSKQVDSVLHTLHRLRELYLSDAHIDSNAFTVTPEMRNIKYIELDNVKMISETWQTFVHSLLTLHQSVQVDMSFNPEFFDSSYCVYDNELFEIMYDVYENNGQYDTFHVILRTKK